MERSRARNSTFPGDGTSVSSTEVIAQTGRGTLAFRGVIWREDWELRSPVPKSEGP